MEISTDFTDPYRWKRTLRSKLLTCFDLVRLPNLFTAAADILAGFFFAGGLAEQWPMTLRLCLASICLYAGGAVLNDVCDAQCDVLQRPQRPIPSGRVSRRAATRLVWVLLALGVVLAATVSMRSLAIAVAICFSIVLYNYVLKSTVVAPCVMGACRALNLALGMLPVSSLLSGEYLNPIVLYWLYVTSATFFAVDEAIESRPLRLYAGTLGITIAALFLAACLGFRPAVDRGPVLLAMILAGIVAWTGFAAARSPRPRVVQTAVRRFVILMVVFDACLAWAGAGPAAALATGSLLVPTLLLAYGFRMT